MPKSTNTKIDINFLCFKYVTVYDSCTLFLFYPKGKWDQEKRTLEDAIVKYPPNKYNWLHIE